MHWVNAKLLVFRMALSCAVVSKDLPPGRVPVASIGNFPSCVSQRLVKDRKLAGAEVEDAAVVMNDGVEEELRLAPHVGSKVVVELGKAIRIGLPAAQVPKLEPLPAEVLHQRGRFRIGQHALHL